MIVSTTSIIEGKTIKEYKGIVYGEVINGIYFKKDFAASITNFVGGRSEEYEKELVESRTEAMNEMIERAKGMGANAIVGVKTDIETIGGERSMLMVVVSGTAVVLE